MPTRTYRIPMDTLFASPATETLDESAILARQNTVTQGDLARQRFNEIMNQDSSLFSLDGLAPVEMQNVQFTQELQISNGEQHSLQQLTQQKMVQVQY